MVKRRAEKAGEQRCLSPELMIDRFREINRPAGPSR